MSKPLSVLVRRLAERVRNFSQLSYQVGLNQRNDYEVAKDWPGWMDEIGGDLVEIGHALRSKSTEVDAYISRRAEDSEALMTLAQGLANFGTVFGPTGWNFEIRTHGDAEYITTILKGANLEAFQEAVRALPDDRKRELGLMEDDTTNG